MHRKTVRLLLGLIVAAAVLLALVAVAVFAGADTTRARWATAPPPPAPAVKLVFVHHSTGENWLADGDGGLGRALRDNNYYVSDTNYGWGPDSIGDRTDIGHWWTWFLGPSRNRYTSALYTEYGQHSTYSRLQQDPGGENRIVLFKSCFPNSQLDGSPTAPPTTGANPLRGQDSGSSHMTVANAKGIYNDLLPYFAAHQDKLFITVTAPPLVSGATDAAGAANARAFNNWLVNDWLDGYAHDNVAVFDFYNVLTSNGGNRNTNDLGSDTGNHHRWRADAVQHMQTVASNTSAYGTDAGDSHPTSAGNRKATAEFVPLLNHRVQTWQAGLSPQSNVFLPAVLDRKPPPTPKTTSKRLQPGDLTYAGAFRLPNVAGDHDWEYSGHALTYYPDGDPAGAADGYAGSLFATGHNWYQHVAEISVPPPVISPAKRLGDLNRAQMLQPFHNIRGDLYDFANFEIPRAGLAYLPAQGKQNSGKLHFCWGQHFHESGVEPTHGWSELTLDQPNPAGTWALGQVSNYATTDYLTDIPAAWAAEHTPGKLLATGRFRDGGWSGQGPALYAYGPWNQGNPPAAGATLPATNLLQYDSSETTGTHTMTGYHHSDEWSGAAWLTAGDRAAVVFVGTKGLGDCWYGFADGTVWPDDPPYPPIPDPPYDQRGWWSDSFAARILFYDPADLAAVADGKKAAYAPQPYATLDIDQRLYQNRQEWQKERLGAAAFDRQHGLLYILELFADGDAPLVHVWKVSGGG